MKRFIAISFFAAVMLPIFACGWAPSTNYYLFHVYNPGDFNMRVQETCDNNWKAYLGTNKEYFWFDADEIKAAAQKKGDDLMLGYVENLQKYLDCVSVEQRKQNEWDYPTKEEISQARATLQAVRNYALSKTQTKLRSQHALLFMRCNMMLGRHEGNVSYWENTAKDFIETVYKDMMKNIYAGALYRTGQTERAGELFAEMGDYNSLMTIYYQKRSCQAIEREYQENPNSKVLPFLLQDFVNNTQEAHDAERSDVEFPAGKLFIRDISRAESQQMQRLCKRVVSEGKTESPIMWKSALAWLEFMDGQRQEAARDIIAATELAGDDRMKSCARELMLYITAALAKPSETFDDYLADELLWLEERTEDRYIAQNVIARLANQILYRRYADTPERTAALMFACGDGGYSYLDTVSVEQVERYLVYSNTPARNKLDRFLKSRGKSADEADHTHTIEELIGTKYMRLCQWEKALLWLENVPVDYYNVMCSAPYRYYALKRNYKVGPWFKRQWLKESEAYESNLKWQASPKVAFCREMQAMEASLNLLNGDALYQCYYDLAVRYAQANYTGDCWWLMRQTKSVGDSVRSHETDLAARAVTLLQKALQTSDNDLRQEVLFALGYRELYRTALWRESEWDYELHDFVYQYYPQAPQFQAYRQLFDEVEDAPEEPMYVVKCDEYQAFRKYYLLHRQ